MSEMIPQVPVRVRFRLRFWPIYLMSLSGGMLAGIFTLAGPVLVSLVLFGKVPVGFANRTLDFYVETALWMATFINVWTVVATFVLIRLMTTRVRAEGIFTYNSFGWPVRMTWADMVDVQWVKTLGIPMVQVTSSAGKKLKFASYSWQAQPTELVPAVERCAGADHLLTVWLKTHWKNPHEDD